MRKGEKLKLKKTLRFKVLLSGEAAVGKTSILHRFVHDKFQGSYTATIGLDFLSKVLMFDGFECRLTIWDLYVAGVKGGLLI
jgi:small GTP-binding protein